MPQINPVALDDGSAIYELPSALTLDKNDIDFNIESFKIAMADGSRSDGGEVKAKKIVVTGTVITDGTREEHRALMNRIRHECSKPDQKLRIKGTEFVRLRLLEAFDDGWERGFDKTVSPCRISWQCDDPFWYRDTEEQVVQVISSSPYDLSVNTLDEGAGMYPCIRGQSPIITVTASDGAVSSFTLQNVTDGGLQMRYSDPGLTAGQSAALNCFDGTATRAGLNTVRYLEGEWLKLLTGANVLRYTGPAATLSVLWRPRWL